MTPMSQEPIKICSSCGAEYSVEAQICADCGGKLVFPQDYEKRFEALTEEDEHVLIREASFGYLKELMEQMTKKGIRANVRFHAQVPGGCSSKSCSTRAVFGLYVAKPDEVAAKDIDRAHWLRGAPEEASSFEYTEQELKGICPACSTPVPEGSAECPECGLVVRAVEDAAECPDCGAEVADDATKCPHCGAEFE
jgi:predicted amidophosphoribosyltransferase